MGICSLDRPQGKGSLRDLRKAIRPYGNPMEQDIIDMAETLMEGQTPMEQLRRFLTPEQQSRFETMEMIFTAMQAKAMNKDKLAMLTEFAERIEHSDKNNLMEAFMTINMEARQKGVQFNDRETDLLVNILSSRMPPSEKKKIDLLKMLSKKIAGPR